MNLTAVGGKITVYGVSPADNGVHMISVEGDFQLTGKFRFTIVTVPVVTTDIMPIIPNNAAEGFQVGTYSVVNSDGSPYTGPEPVFTLNP